MRRYRAARYPVQGSLGSHEERCGVGNKMEQGLSWKFWISPRSRSWSHQSPDIDSAISDGLEGGSAQFQRPGTLLFLWLRSMRAEEREHRLKHSKRPMALRELYAQESDTMTAKTFTWLASLL